MVNPKLKEFAPLQPGVVPAEDTVQRTSNEQESAAPTSILVFLGSLMRLIVLMLFNVL